jgi:apolipoprotein N-acyltransferase
VLHLHRRATVGLLLRTLTCAAAGLAAALSFEPYHWALLLPVSVAAVTIACAGVPARRAFWLASLFGAVFMVVLLPWLRVIGWYAWVPLSVAEGLFYGLAGLATALVSRGRWWPLWAACSWVVVELLRGLLPFGGFPWGRLAFATEDTALAPWFGYVGPAGVTFLVALLGTTLAWAALTVRRTPRRALTGVVAVLVLCGLASWLPASFPGQAADGRQVRVAVVQGNVPGEGLEAFAERRAVLDNHVEATMGLAGRIDAGRASRPDLVVWPENSSDIDPYTDPTAAAAISSAARAVGAPLLMGAVVGDRTVDGWHNRALVWLANGRPGGYYDKIHPVPFGEYIPLRGFLAPRIPALDQIPSDMIPGDRPGVLRVGSTRVGALMCFEVAYDGLVHSLIRDGADLLVVPTNNATYTGTGQVEQQFAMSRLRAIETGRFVVVASTNGISGIIAPDGQVVARAPARVQQVLEQKVTLRTGMTAAVRFGPWLEGLLTAAALASVTAMVALGYRRRPQPQLAPAPVQTEGQA